MKKLLSAALSVLLAVSAAHAQKIISDTQPYGKVEKADLELKSCEFEKDANAMVLFDKGDLYYDDNLNIVIEHHKRIKIFNDNGKKSADVRLEYYGGSRFEYMKYTGKELLAEACYNLNIDLVQLVACEMNNKIRESIRNRTKIYYGREESFDDFAYTM